jgi:hypothetical protein
MKPRTLLFVLIVWGALEPAHAAAQTGAGEPADALGALEFRAVGPALTSGRIADVAVDPRNRSVWYVATASGGLWKTTNRGLTFSPIFDTYDSYTMCCVLIDPRNSNVLWLATGENTNLRSAMAGTGIYRSTDAGVTWQSTSRRRGRSGRPVVSVACTERRMAAGPGTASCT